MSDRQKKITDDAFLLLAAAARKGRRLAEAGDVLQVRAHLREVEEMVKTFGETLDLHVGATTVLGLVEGGRAKALPRAKPLSRGRAP